MLTVAECLVNRAKQEYLEMPGLALTLGQASRLWNLDPETCEGLLDVLMRERFLAETAEGAYVRVTADMIRVGRLDRRTD